MSRPSPESLAQQQPSVAAQGGPRAFIRPRGTRGGVKQQLRKAQASVQFSGSTAAPQQHAYSGQQHGSSAQVAIKAILRSQASTQKAILAALRIEHRFSSTATQPHQQLHQQLRQQQKPSSGGQQHGGPSSSSTAGQHVNMQHVVPPPPPRTYPAAVPAPSSSQAAPLSSTREMDLDVQTHKRQAEVACSSGDVKHSKAAANAGVAASGNPAVEAGARPALVGEASASSSSSGVVLLSSGQRVPVGPEVAAAYSAAVAARSAVSSAGIKGSPVFKTALCNRFMVTGQCTFGDRCTFAHGVDELRNRPG